MIFLSKSLKEHDLEKDCQTQFLQNHKKNKKQKKTDSVIGSVIQLAV